MLATMARHAARKLVAWSLRKWRSPNGRHRAMAMMAFMAANVGGGGFFVLILDTIAMYLFFYNGQ